MKQKLVIGTRKSPLALWQTEYIKSELLKKFPETDISILHIVTSGDKSQDSLAPIPQIGGKGLFTAELEEALRLESIDLAVHSLKDLPTTQDPDFVLGAIPVRASPYDALLSRTGKGLRDLPLGAVVGTSSVRRVAQIKRLRPDVRTAILRGNLDTRISKMRRPDGEFDAIILAAAGLERLGKAAEITQVLTADEMMPAPGQGALAIQCRSGDTFTRKLLETIHHLSTSWAITAERAFLNALGAGCNTPVGALAIVEDVAGDLVLSLTGRCLSLDGATYSDYSESGAPEQAEELGVRAARRALADGFKKLGEA